MAISNAGQDESKAITNKIYEYEKTNRPYLLYKMKFKRMLIHQNKDEMLDATGLRKASYILSKK